MWERTAAFSPPAWGWSAAVAMPTAAVTVLPTRVGMVRKRPDRAGRATRSPHPRGDGPSFLSTLLTVPGFSPPAWGWSGIRGDERAEQGVLPTRVGMVRKPMHSIRIDNCSPHPRGDGPRATVKSAEFEKFSPPAWGWSGVYPRACPGRPVLPTRVGMVRSASMPRSMSKGSPHPRGDGPPLPTPRC